MWLQNQDGWFRVVYSEACFWRLCRAWEIGSQKILGRAGNGKYRVAFLRSGRRAEQTGKHMWTWAELASPFYSDCRAYVKGDFEVESGMSEVINGDIELADGGLLQRSLYWLFRCASESAGPHHVLTSSLANVAPAPLWFSPPYSTKTWSPLSGIIIKLLC